LITDGQYIYVIAQKKAPKKKKRKYSLFKIDDCIEEGKEGEEQEPHDQDQDS
jgi:hypothetical protein